MRAKHPLRPRSPSASPGRSRGRPSADSAKRPAGGLTQLSVAEAVDLDRWDSQEAAPYATYASPFVSARCKCSSSCQRNPASSVNHATTMWSGSTWRPSKVNLQCLPGRRFRYRSPGCSSGAISSVRGCTAPAKVPVVTKDSPRMSGTAMTVPSAMDITLQVTSVIGRGDSLSTNPETSAAPSLWRTLTPSACLRRSERVLALASSNWLSSSSSRLTFRSASSLTCPRRMRSWSNPTHAAIAARSTRSHVGMSPQLAGRCHGAPKTSMPRRKPASRQPAAALRTRRSLSQEGSRSGFTAERYLIDGRERGDNGQPHLSQMDGPSLGSPYEAAHLITVTSDRIRQHAGGP